MAKITDYSDDLPKRIGNLVVYKLHDYFIVRTQSGFTSEALLNDTKYAKIRNNATEFGNVSSLSKAIRMALALLLPKTNTLAVVNSFTKKMRELMNYDLVSDSGKRNLAEALRNPAGRAVLKDYDFNPDSHLDFEYTLNQNLITLDTASIVFPKQSSRIGFRTHVLSFDFTSRENQLESTAWHSYNKSELPQRIELPLAGIAETERIKFTLLETYFYTAVEQNLLGNDGLRSLKILGINP